MSEVLCSWKVSTKKNRSSLWYIVAFSIAIGFIVWWFLTGQYMMSFVIILLSWISFFVENNSSDETEIVLTETGIQIWDNFYDYGKVHSFWVVYNKDAPFLLRIILKTKILPVNDFHVDSEIVNKVRPVLQAYVQENENMELSFTDKIIHILKL